MQPLKELDERAPLLKQRVPEHLSPLVHYLVDPLRCPAPGELAVIIYECLGDSRQESTAEFLRNLFWPTQASPAPVEQLPIGRLSLRIGPLGPNPQHRRTSHNRAFV